MSPERSWETPAAFMDALAAVPPEWRGEAADTIRVPFPPHGMEEVVGGRGSRLKFFTLAGSLFGLLAGFGLTIYTVHVWPLITGGKPLISITAFIIIAFEMTILFGAITSFLGFLLLAGLPSLTSIRDENDPDNRFFFDPGESDQP